MSPDMMGVLVCDYVLCLVLYHRHNSVLSKVPLFNFAALSRQNLEKNGKALLIFGKGG